MHFIFTIFRILFAFFCSAKKPLLGFGRCCAQKCRLLFAFGICQKKNPPFEYSVQPGKPFPCSFGHVAFLNPKFCRNSFYDNDLLFCFLPFKGRVFRRNRHILNWNQFLTILAEAFAPPYSPPQKGYSGEVRPFVPLVARLACGFSRSCTFFRVMPYIACMLRFDNP
jgi:hypothetical protein